MLRYIRNTSKRFQTFVAHRLQTIHDALSPNQWRDVPTKLNPADLASRGSGIKMGNKEQGKQDMQFWLNGPEFLWKEWICAW